MGGGLLFPIHEHGVASPFAWRQYQLNAVDAAKVALQTSSRCLLILPCGTGKTEIIARLIATSATHGRALVVSPFVTLVGQTANRLRLRGVPCGVEQGPLRSDQPVTVASYLSLISRNRYQSYLDSFGPGDLVIVDESHRNYSPQAIAILTAFADAGCHIVGMTASPDRASGDPITEFYRTVAYHYTLKQAIEDGWLVEPKVWVTVAGDLDLSKFDGGFGDFNAEQVAKELAKEQNVQTVTNLILQHHEGDPSVVFCSGVLQANKVKACLWRAGVEAAIIYSQGMDEDERRLNLSLFESGELNIILNVGCLTTGWDCDKVAKLFMCRPTRSRSLYQQMLGRGTRPLAGTVDAYSTAALRRDAIAASKKPVFEVFDLVDASRHNDLVTAVDAIVEDPYADAAKRVRAKREGQEGVTLTALGELLMREQEVLAEERRAQAAELAAQEALTAHLKAGMVADVAFGNYERDAFAAAEGQPKKPVYRGWRWLFGQHKGKPLPEMELGYMQWALRKNILKGAFKAAVEREVSKRLSR